MPESHWIATTVVELDKFLHNKIARTWLQRELVDELYAERARLLRAWDACRGSEQLLAAQFVTGQLAH